MIFSFRQFVDLQRDEGIFVDDKEDGIMTQVRRLMQFVPKLYILEHIFEGNSDVPEKGGARGLNPFHQPRIH